MLLGAREVVDERRFKPFPPFFANLYNTNRVVSVENFRTIQLTGRGLRGLEHQVTFLQLASFEPRIFNSQAHQNTAGELSFHFQSKL